MNESDKLIENAERLLQEWLRIKPPPFYIARWLIRPETTKSISYWENLLKENFLKGVASDIVKRYLMVDGLRIADASNIARLNSLAYQQHLHLLDDAENLLRLAIKNMANDSTCRKVKAQECLSYVMTERYFTWTIASEPVFHDPAFLQTHRINPNTPDILRCLNACNHAFELATSSGVITIELAKEQPTASFLAHRAAYNIGRIHLDVGADLDLAFKYLKESFYGLEIYRGINGPPADPYWEARRTEILHSLVELSVLRHGRVEVDFMEMVQYLKDYSLTHAIAKRSIHGTVGAETSQMLIRLEAFKDDFTINLPIIYNWDAIDKQLGEDIAILDYTLTDKHLRISFIHKLRKDVFFFDPDIVHAGGDDHFFRPSGVDLQSTINPEVSQDFFVEQPSSSILEWTFLVDWIALKPENSQRWNIHPIQKKVVLGPGHDWTKTLYQILIKPFESDLQQLNIKHLIIVPDLILSLIPFHLMQNGSGEFLGDKYKISYAPNMAVVVDALAHERKRPLPSSLLIIKDPTQTLQMAELESAMITKLFQPKSVRVLDSTTATRENIASAIRDADIIHFCTHGRFDSEEPEKSGLCVKNGHWLTLDEIRAFEIPNGATVYLSACETARLKLSSRVYSIGIVPAFLEAGASTVISTFWEVEDVSTALVADRFYKNLIVSRLDHLESLADATKWIRRLNIEEIKEIIGKPNIARRSYSDYYFWGGFALYGSWT